MTPEPGQSPDPRRAARKRAFGFFRLASALLFAGVGALALAARFDFFGAGFHINLAAVFGVAATILLGVGLMALSFYSDRSGADDGVVNMDDSDENSNSD